MKKINYVLFAFIVCLQIGYSQSIDLFGKVQSNSDVENVHVINKTAQKFTITNALGEFKISVSLKDTLVFTSIQYQLETVLVDEQVMLNKTLIVTLTEQIKTLDEVVVGKVLSGDIMQDIGAIQEEPMTSKKAGIPSYQGKPKTQSERRLNEATTGGGIVPLNPILNAISGRTKQLKLHIKLEEKETLMYAIKARLSENLFSINSLQEDYIMEYFYFVSEQPDFLEKCKSKSDIEILDYLGEKLILFKSNLKSKTD